MSRKTNRIIKDSVSYKIFIVAAYALILAWSFLCIAPFLNMIAISMSASKYADAFQVGLWPRGFTLAYYGEALTNNQILSSLWISVKRAVLGVVLELFVTMLAAYPMSKDKREFPGRGILSALFIFCMIFSGGLIPNYYLIVNTLNLANTLWALVLPTMLNIGNLILMMNFIRQLPREIEEAALIDGWLFQNAMENNSSSVRQLYTNAYAVYQHRTLELVVRRNDLYERGIELSAQHIPVYNTGQIGQGGEPGAGASGTAVFQAGLDYDVCGDLHASDYTAISDPSEIR